MRKLELSIPRNYKLDKRNNNKQRRKDYNNIFKSLAKRNSYFREIYKFKDCKKLDSIFVQFNLIDLFQKFDKLLDSLYIACNDFSQFFLRLFRREDVLYRARRDAWFKIARLREFLHAIINRIFFITSENSYFGLELNIYFSSLLSSFEKAIYKIDKNCLFYDPIFAVDDSEIYQSSREGNF